MRVALLTAGRDKPYALGIAGALLNAGVELDFIGNDEMEGEKVLKHPHARYYNQRKDQSVEANIVNKICRVIAYYYRLIPEFCTQLGYNDQRIRFFQLI